MQHSLSFIFTAGLFMTAAGASGLYGLDNAQLNLILAAALSVIFNIYGLNGQKKALFAACAGIAALLTFYLAASIWGVWLFAILSLTGSLLKKTKQSLKISLIFTAAFFNLSLITNTAHTDIQYDFASCYNYIEYIIDNNFMFWQENPLLSRPSYSSYHPILSFFVAAAAIKAAIFFGISQPMAAETAQVMFCFYMVWYYFIASRILTLLATKPASEVAGLLFIAFFPAYNAIAGYFNNDCLLLPLQAGTVYYSLKYYLDGQKKNLICIFLFATAASLTKLSGVLVLPVTAAAFAMRLWQKRDKKTLLETTLTGMFILFGVAVWPLYQYFWLHLDFGFVPPQTHLSLEGYTLLERFSPLGGIFYEKDFYNDFGINLWETMTKTALFGQWDFSYRGADIMWLIALLIIIYKILIVVSTIATATLWLKKRSYHLLFASVFLASLLAGQIIFGLKHPFMCNQDFRYVAILPLPMAMILTLFADINSKAKMLILPLSAIFAVLSAFVWWRIAL